MNRYLNLFPIFTLCMVSNAMWLDKCKCTELIDGTPYRMVCDSRRALARDLTFRD